MPYTMTTQRQVRAAFWQAHPDRTRFPKRKIRDYSGNATMYVTDVRCAFSDYVDYLSKDGAISSDLADRVTLD